MTNTEKKWRLEYNEKQGFFHQESLYKAREENTFGWITIAPEEDDTLLRFFCEYMMSKWPDLYGGNRLGNLKPVTPTLKQVQNEWQQFNSFFNYIKICYDYDPNGLVRLLKENVPQDSSEE